MKSSFKTVYRRASIGGITKELSLPVAPACNMMCGFCSKNISCLLNGNKPDELEKALTPRMAIDYAVHKTKINKNIEAIRIKGPGEPLANSHTFEVLRRLNVELPDYKYKISTNGLELNNRFYDLLNLNISSIDLSINAVYVETIAKLYSRIMLKEDVIDDPKIIKDILLESQLEGLVRCISHEVDINVNITIFPGVNDRDVPTIIDICNNIGIRSTKHVYN